LGTLRHCCCVAVGFLALIVIGISVWKFWKSKERSKGLSTFAAVVVMAWTSEGLLSTALTAFKIPAGFAAVSFFVFEALMLSAGMKAEENRKSHGEPGAIGRYVFVIGVCSGLIASFGAGSLGLAFLRIILPPLSIGQWWILLKSPRDDDKPEWKEARKKRVEEREATWAITPRTLLVKWGIMKPGKATTTEAQRAHQMTQMVIAAEIIDAEGTAIKRSRRARKASRRLRKLTRTADAEMIRDVARQVRWTVDAERLMVPSKQTQGEPVALDILLAGSAQLAIDQPPARQSEALPAGPPPAAPGIAVSGIGQSEPEDGPQSGTSGRAVESGTVPQAIGHFPSGSRQAAESGTAGRSSGMNGRAFPVGHRAVESGVVGRALPEGAVLVIGQSEPEDARQSGTAGRAVGPGTGPQANGNAYRPTPVPAPRRESQPARTVEVDQDQAAVVDVDVDDAADVEQGQEQQPARTVEVEAGQTAGLTPAQEREAARQLYRRTVANGEPISGAELARRFGRTDPKWGTRQIDAVRRQMAAPAAQDEEDQPR
jgi:hypothetical protein